MTNSADALGPSETLEIRSPLWPLFAKVGRTAFVVSVSAPAAFAGWCRRRNEMETRITILLTDRSSGCFTTTELGRAADVIITEFSSRLLVMPQILRAIKYASTTIMHFLVYLQVACVARWCNSHWRI